MEFTPFQKLARWSRDIVVTEKIDGTNACIAIEVLEGFLQPDDKTILYADGGLGLRAGSRTRWITTGDDNFGFARWVVEHKEELMRLGPGLHRGEWWGAGIQRGYGLMEKRFSLFNTALWGDQTNRPACCGVVPVLYQGPNDPGVMEQCIADLAASGSYAAPGFVKPEGVVMFHTASGVSFKKTVERDESPKGMHAKSDHAPT